jgi:hypothetical protein
MLWAVGRRRFRPLRIIGGTLLMAGAVMLGFLVLSQYAGAWGVPYFTFTTERGSTCKNDFTGYTCTPLTLAEVEFHGEVDLPDDTSVVSGTYRSTHDYQLNAVLDVPAASADAAIKALNEAYGHCLRGQPPPMDTTGLSKVCVITNKFAVSESGEPASRLYTIGTGVRSDGSRTIVMQIRSR